MPENYSSYFVKTSSPPASHVLTREQKYKLNRRGNELFNSNNIDAAKKIFVTTGYSDGLTRVGDYYVKQNKRLDALKYYVLAHNNTKMDSIITDIVRIIKMYIKMEL